LIHKRRAGFRNTLGFRSLVAIVLLSVPLLLAAATISLSTPPRHDSLPRIHYDETRTSDLPLPHHKILLPIESGDTLETLLNASGLGAADARRLAADFTEHIDPRRVRAGEFVELEFDPQSVLQKVSMWSGVEGRVEARREGESFLVDFVPAVITTEQVALTGTIETSLYDTLNSAGESPALVAELVDVFQWDIDFFALRKGDSFSLVVDRRYSDGRLTGYSPIKVAKFSHKGVTHEAFRFDPEGGQGGYYAADGTPMKKQFLRAPLKFSRITSGYTKKRFHPVLKEYRPHYGVDYGAPTGTPVMATADGTVVSASYGKASGNMVRLRHVRKMETYYLHLSRFAKGIKPGVHVRQGQVIGYVGSTGLSTAPHLDYRIKVNGSYINPLSLRSVAPDPLKGDALARFRETRDQLLPLLEQAGTAVARDENTPRQAPSL
jgi:murein DD-endopeptidase MepM/ murein hydrolase activator NlpD